VASEAASVQLTGGAGFNFEDEVAAFFLAAMLAGVHPYGTDLGTIAGLSWQTRGDGWRVDDLAVRFERPGHGTLGLSIKSDRQVTASGFPAHFVQAVWEQYSDTGSSNPFQRHRDLVGLAVGQLAGTVREAWHTLLRDVRLGDPTRIAARYSTPGESLELGRRLLQSFVSPQHPSMIEAISIVKHVRLMYFDFRDTGSQSEAVSVWATQLALCSGDGAEAIALWRRLVGIAAEYRGAGGSIDAAALLAALRNEFQLKDRVDHAGEWGRLDRRSGERAEDVTESIAGRLSLLRRDVMDDLRSRVAEGRCILLAGEGGSGKSALAKRLGVGARPFRRYVWLDAASLDYDSMDEVERHLGIATPFTELLAECAAASSCLIFDGLETFTPRSIARAIAILKALAPSPVARGWTVVATTRPQAVDQAHLAFQRAGVVGDLLSTRYVEGPTEAECATVLAGSPRLNASLLGRELRAAIRNLKLLDWMVADADQIPEAEVAAWLGVSQVVDSLWRRWVGTDAAAAARAGVMKTLARLEGEGFQQGIGTSRLQAPEHAVLPELESRELLRLKDERIWFRHDMLGDWSRLRVLIEEAGGGSTALADFARFPRWHDAIRLYGQRLLDTDTSAPARWVATVGGLTGESPTTVIARDMLLEGLFCSANASTLIAKAWSALCSNNGVLLRRLFKRFLYAATIPDPRVSLLVEQPGDAVELSPHWRFPWWPLWPGILAVLASHADDVTRLAPLEAAQISALWLRSMPVGALGRVEAAQLALAVGREIQGARGEGLHFHNNHEDKTVFEAVLYAAPELPDEAAAICLELSRRRPDPPHVIARARAHAERSAREAAERLPRNAPKQRRFDSSASFFDMGQLREQFPDGPSARVDEGLQRAVHDGQGILSLASIRPDVAREVLLACSLEQPRHVRYGDALGGMLDHLGVEDRFESAPPMFFRSAWLPLLRQDSELGIDCIVRLVNQATLNWEATVSAEAPPDSGAATRVNVPTDVGTIEYVGDMRVYGWYRERLCSAPLLVSALMALEKWLYERIEQEQSVDAAIRHILRSSRSVAVLGVLVAAGMFRPELLRGPLLSLLGIWRLYEWDFHLAIDGDSWQIGLLHWARSGDRIFNMVRDWNMMPHRKRSLRDSVVPLLLTQQDITDRFATIRTEWRAELESGRCIATDSLELLLARFNPANYHFKARDDNYVEVTFEWPEPLRAKTDTSLKKLSEGSRLLGFPIECRKLLDAGVPLPDREAESIWAQLQRIAAMDPEEPESDLSVERKPDAMFGGIAVLVSLAPDWLAADQVRQDWCTDRLALVLSNPPQPTLLDSEHSISTDRWHSFMAEIAVAMLSESPQDPSARAFAADAIMSFWYATTGVGLRMAYRLRGKLGGDFNRLVNLSVLWSALRCIRVPHDANGGDKARMITRRARLIGAFSRRQIPTSMMDWPRVSAVATRAHDRLYRRRVPRDDPGDTAQVLPGESSPCQLSVSSSRQRAPRLYPGFDIEALKYSFSWLPTPSVGLSASERRQNLAWLRELLSVSLRMLPASNGEDDVEVEGTPYKYDRWVFDTVSTFVAQMTPQEDPGQLWRPILELGPAAHYWVECFLSAWTVSALKAAPSAAQFFQRWKEMIEFATQCPTWMPSTPRRHFRLRQLWEHLLGMHFGASIVGADGHQQHFADLIPMYGVWAAAFLDEDRSLRAYLRLLNQDGARPLLCPSIPWLLRAAERVRPFEWARDPIADEAAAVLRRAWTWHGDDIAADADLRLSFSTLLNLLVTHQSNVAMDLRDRVSRVIQTPPIQ
jgi:hypothetical protein